MRDVRGLLPAPVFGTGCNVTTECIRSLKGGEGSPGEIWGEMLASTDLTDWIFRGSTVAALARLRALGLPNSAAGGDM